MQQPGQQQQQSQQQQPQQQDPTTSMMAAAAAAGMQGQANVSVNLQQLASGNPLMAQQAALMTGAAGATPQQMAMMNPLLRNQLANPSTQLNAAAVMSMNPNAAMGNVIPAAPLNANMNAGIHPTMPPPNMGSMRSSFSNGPGNPTGTEDNVSLSPNSFKW